MIQLTTKIVIESVEKKTKAQWFKDIQEGDEITVNMPLQDPGGSRNGLYATQIRCRNDRTQDELVISITNLVKRLENFKYSQADGEVHSVYVNQDCTEGRGPMMMRGLFTTEREAQRFADSQEPYGHPGQFTRVDTDEIYAKAESHPTWNQKMYDKIRDRADAQRRKHQIRVHALGKLTKEEREALGVS